MRAHIGTDLLLLPSVAAILRDSAGHILFHQRTDDDRWSLPAGAIACGEDPWTALVREVYEETGYAVHDGFVRGVFGGKHGFRHIYPNGDQVEYT
ncbi:MAG: NUDIX domain-containing protein, partial [Rhodospirillales bacterium]|nr:NUDIX domain-containing protein [Rhodospirillales bacterium]